MAKKSKPKRNVWRTLLRVILMVLTAIAAVGTVAGAFGGDYSPTTYRYICLMVMTFPLWLIFLILISIADALWCRKALFFTVVAVIVSAPAIWNFSPLVLFGPSESKYADCPKIKLLSYNVCNFEAMDSIYPDSTNRTLSFIINTNADIVCLQEASGFSYDKRIKAVIKSSQVDSISRMYPYILLCERTQMVLSKYPAKVIPTGYKKKGSNEIATVRITVEGVDITIFNVHLQPFNLANHDKALYSELTSIDRNDLLKSNSMDSVKSQLLSKIQRAAEGREYDAERLCRYLGNLGGPNVIVTGDFNDVPGCYTLHRLADCNMHEVYPEVGFGPMITYYDNNFYFRIDHTLYRGALKPLRMERPSVKFSDHYPIITTFALTNSYKQ
ncbi:MAG: endonuclease/exonuclease/phosphatase family protein [Muribaculaceae bacterium]